MSSSELKLPAAPGSYLLELYLRRRTALEIGRLGRFAFARGWYYYAGSALGPGGLRARLAHHCKPLHRCHWHIDYLRTAAQIRAAWYLPGGNNEHLWSAALGRLLIASIPAPGFGASDCRCASHLLYFPRRPSRQQILAALGADSGARRTIFG